MNNFMAMISSGKKSIGLPKEYKVGDDKSDTKINTKDFISILFSQISNSKGKSEKTNIKIPIDIQTSIKDAPKKDSSKSSNELLLGEILNIVNLLKEDVTKTSFPKFSDKLEKILNDKSTLNDFKNIKNIDDLFKVSKKYNLGLKDIKFTKESVEILKKDFPKLDIEKFFKSNKSNIADFTEKQNTLLTKNDKHAIIKNLIQGLPEKSRAEEPKNILQSLLKNPDENTKKVIIKDIEEDKKNKVEQYTKKDKRVYAKQNIEEDKKNDSTTINKLPKENIQATQKTLKKTINNTFIPKEALHVEQENGLKPVKKEALSTKHIQKKDISIGKIITGEAEQKKQSNQVSQERVSHKIKIHKNINSQNINNIQNLETDDKTEMKNSNDTKTEIVSNKQEFKHHIQNDTFKTNKPIEAKNSLNQFSNDLKEKIDNYKPPLMKLKMALNPKHLGEVEVTLIHRGNNLHVNIVSNTNTMSIFTQNQAEFKNSLVNMGFTNLEMNFSDQGKNSGQNQQKKKENHISFEEFNNQDNYESSVELVVPRYV